MNTMPDAQLCHIGLYAFDLETMVDFYSRTFGLVVTDRGHSKRGFDIAFLSRDPIEHHQIAIASGRPKEAVHTTVNQISFRVSGLDSQLANMSLGGATAASVSFGLNLAGTIRGNQSASLKGARRKRSKAISSWP